MSAWSNVPPEARAGLFLFTAFVGIGVAIGVAATLVSLRCGGVM